MHLCTKHAQYHDDPHTGTLKSSNRIVKPKIKIQPKPLVKYISKFYKENKIKLEFMLMKHYAPTNVNQALNFEGGGGGGGGGGGVRPGQM